MEIQDWIKKTMFQCDVTMEHYSYTKLHIAWYDKSVEEDGKTKSLNDKFMLVKQGEGFRKLSKHIDGWSLSSRQLEDVYTENIVVFFTSFLVVNSLHDKGNFENETNIKSWNQLFRRLTVPYYEKARHRLQEAKQMDDFLELTEDQLLQFDTLASFVRQVYGTANF